MPHCVFILIHRLWSSVSSNSHLQKATIYPEDMAGFGICDTSLTHCYRWSINVMIGIHHPTSSRKMVIKEVM